MPHLIEKLLQRMAPLFQPGVAEDVEGLVFGCDGGPAGPAVDLVNGARGFAGRRYGFHARFHASLILSRDLGFDATQVCYARSMPSVTSSFRMSKELQRELSDVAERTGKGKNAIIIEALVKHLHTMERESLAGEARRQSELVSRNRNDTGWYGLADTSGWR